MRESLGEQVATLKRRLEGASIQPSLQPRTRVAESANVPGDSEEVRVYGTKVVVHKPITIIHDSP